jgi:2-polyprenyl-3-methyl-5-hydroxy-6-metoxy-1,4-benzoquinol methylase
MDGIPEISYDEQHFDRFQKTANVVRDILPASSTVLDYGCHSGGMAEILIKLGYEVTGADLQCEYDRYGKVYHQIGMKFVQLDNIPGQYDCVLFLEVLEHLHDNPVPVIERLLGYLNPGGCLIISTPNVAKLENRIKLLLGVNIYQDIYRFVYDERHRNHYREYSKRDLYKIVGYAGVNVVAFKSFDNIGGRTVVKRLAQRILRCITFFVPSLRSVHLIIVRK